jgi:hypothetical protein
MSQKRRRSNMQVDKRAFLKDLKGMENNIINDMNYNPERDMARLILKYNLEWHVIMKKIKKELTL